MSLRDFPEKLLDTRVDAAEPAAPIRLTLAGELDQEESGRLVDALTEVVRSEPGRPLELDCADLTFLNSAGVRALLICRRHAEQFGSPLSITRISAIGHQVLEITGLLEIFGSPGVHSTKSPGATAASRN